MFALALPMLLGVAGTAMDFAVFSMKQTILQTAADAAALAGSKQLSLASSTASNVESTALTFLTEELRNKSESATGKVTVDRKAGSVTVHVVEEWTPFFAQFIGADITPVKASATATLAGETKLCMLALETHSSRAINMQEDAHIEANGCAVYSNSAGQNSIVINDAATIAASMICSVGGVKNKSGSTNKAILTDCPVLDDPVANHPIPAIGACNFYNTKISSGNTTLQPGVYCGGIEISKTAIVAFAPGTYFLKNGQFKVSDTASVSGKNVAFFLSGIGSTLAFVGDATINLSGAEEGVLAGFLFFNDPFSLLPRTHIISATHANNLTGTIYLPNANLKVDPSSNVGANSAYTVIIVNKISVEMGPHLILNTNYGATKVPVPMGIVSSTSVVLSN